ncbi:hypothetical protein [uncultured Mailhella sp.]|uniref:hypothetical protein n=1 Tax=uncultured Mailhella sp. TaxID=1981031 RepID=UPI0025EE11C2|nr:hypothetical protein [uncultured Mailhella sp.]
MVKNRCAAAVLRCGRSYVSENRERGGKEFLHVDCNASAAGAFFAFCRVHRNKFETEGRMIVIFWTKRTKMLQRNILKILQKIKT